MRVFISVDMEGIAGIATLDQIIRGGYGYPRAQTLMTDETNAAIRGALAGGADEVIVNDSHGTMDNLVHADLDPRARLVFGAPRPSCMVSGISREDALAIFVGYHAAAGADGVLAHTYSSSFSELRVNGHPMSEAEVNALLAASLGVPIGVVTGDEDICAVARKAFPGVATVETKKAHGMTATDTIHPAVACEQIEATVAEAVAQSSELRPLEVPAELSLEIDFPSAVYADFASIVPGSERVSANTVRRTARSVDELMSTIMSWYYLCVIPSQQMAGIAQRR